MTSNWSTFISLLASSFATCFFAPSTERKPANTLCPELANFSAVRRPNPLDAPVTKTIFDMSILLSSVVREYRTVFLYKHGGLSSELESAKEITSEILLRSGNSFFLYLAKHAAIRCCVVGETSYTLTNSL